MFEESLFESQHRVASPRKRWTVVASISLQAAVASLLVILPLLHTEILPDNLRAPKMMVPLPAPPTPPRQMQQRVASAVASMVPVLGRVLAAPRITPSRIDSTPEPPGPTAPFTGMGTPTGLPDGLVTNTGTATSVVVATPVQHKPMAVSAGVITGYLLAPIQPVYPRIAIAAHVEGSVVVEAVISKTGSIESLHVISGSPMLQTAAINAIRAARYRPFLLNGAPTEVQTTITVNFVLSH